jgi:hypothetical protein
MALLVEEFVGHRMTDEGKHSGRGSVLHRRSAFTSKTGATQAAWTTRATAQAMIVTSPVLHQIVTLK